MSSPELKLVGRYVRDLLDHDPNLMIEGRANEEQMNFDINYIAYDTNSTAQRLSNSETYDPDNEVQTLNIKFSQQFSISFYGANAYENKDRFTLLQSSQFAEDKQFELGITVYLNSGVTDLKLQTGDQYQNRLDVTLTVLYNKSINISVPRIDELQYTLITNN